MALSSKMDYTRARTNASTPHGRALLLKVVAVNYRLERPSDVHMPRQLSRRVPVSWVQQRHARSSPSFGCLPCTTLFPAKIEALPNGKFIVMQLLHLSTLSTSFCGTDGTAPKKQHHFVQLQIFRLSLYWWR